MLRVTRGELEMYVRHLEGRGPARRGMQAVAGRPARAEQAAGHTRDDRPPVGHAADVLLRIDEWSWPEAPARVPTCGGDLPRQDHPLPKALDDAAAAKLLRAAQNDSRLLVRVTVEVLLRRPAGCAGSS